jgi:hypothetical protein
MEQIQQSNDDLTLTDLEWTFNLRPNTFLAGAGEAMIPSWVKGYLWPLTWKVHFSNEGVAINCAAFAIAFALDRPDRRIGKRQLSVIIEEAQILQQRLKWGQMVTVDALNAFCNLREYQHLRVVVLTRDFRNSRAFVAEGSQFEFDESDTSNIIYLYWDVLSNHYAAIPNDRIQATYNRMHNNQRLKFCHKCYTCWSPMHAAPNNVCNCDDIVVVKRPKISKKCGTCGEHGCTICPKSCGFCLALKTDSNHRCIVYSKGEEKEFWQEGDPEPKNLRSAKPRLWVYDLEAAIVRSEKHGFAASRTEDGANFVVDSEGVPQLFETVFMKHNVNLVVLRCVFSGFEKIFSGPNCLEHFLMYLLDVNKGVNICIAHNGSGYDSRHIMDSALLLQRDCQMTPLSRGCKFMQLEVGKFYIC